MLNSNKCLNFLTSPGALKSKSKNCQPNVLIINTMVFKDQTVFVHFVSTSFAQLKKDIQLVEVVTGALSRVLARLIQRSTTFQSLCTEI